MSRHAELAIAALAAASIAACDATPDLTFVPDGVDDASAAPASRADADAAAAVDARDAIAPALAADASPPAFASGCSAVDPTSTAGLLVCCGDTPCVGLNCLWRCGDCAACGSAFCCAPPDLRARVTCAESAAACAARNGGGKPPKGRDGDG